jgi:hypothetical protein
LVRIVIRRWYVAVPVVVLVLIIGTGLIASAAPTYRASGSVVVLPYDPTNDPPLIYEEVRPPRNPYAEIGGSLNTTAEVLAGAGRGDALRQRVVAEGGTADFTVEKEEDFPILLIEATADRRAQAIDTVSAVADELEAELAARQERLNVPAEEQVALDVVLLPERASELHTDRNRAVTVLIAVGLAAVIAATVAAESIAQGRTRNRQAQAERAAADRAAWVAEQPREADDTPPAMGRLPPPDSSDIAASNGEPSKPAEQRNR